MRYSIRPSPFAAATLGCTSALAIQTSGQLPLHPRCHNMNDMPASAIAMGVPMVLETTDAVHLADLWFPSNAPKSCARAEASGNVEYVCADGSIMIHPHGGKTQVTCVPAMAMMGHSP